MKKFLNLIILIILFSFFVNANVVFNSLTGNITFNTSSQRVIIDNNGNVGINIFAPIEKLHMNGSLRVDGTAGNSILYVNSTSGNVGVGVSNPLARLHINGETLGFANTSFERSRRDVYNPLSWSDTGNSLPSSLSYSSVAVIGDYVYLFGGLSGSNNIIYRAPLNNPTNWSNTGSTLPTALYYSSVAVIGDYVYLFGGLGGSGNIYRAPLNNPTNWSDTGAAIVPFRSSLAIIGDYVYIFAGADNIIYRAPLSNPLSWSNTGATLPSSLSSSSVAVIGDYVYLFGGNNGGGGTNIIYRAPLSNPLSWSNTGSTLPGNLTESSLAVIGDYVYLFGGDNGTSNTNIIYRAPLSNPLSWSNTGSTLPSVLRASSLAVIDNYVYLFGGVGAGSSIYRAGIKGSSEESRFWKYAPDVEKNRYQSLSTAIYSDGGGKIGIGTTNATERLTVNGNLRVDNSTGSQVFFINSSNGLVNVSGVNSQLFVNGSQVCTSANGLCSQTPYQSNASGWSNTSTTTTTSLNVNITNGNLTVVNGNVGIGTNTHNAKLEVSGNNLNLSYFSTDSLGSAVIGDSPSTSSIGKLGSAYTGVYGSSSDMSGKGVYGIASGILGIGVYGTGNKYGIQADSDLGSAGYFSSSSGYAITTGTGNVGIGTTSPSEKLNINGSIRVDNSTGSSVFYVNSTSGNVGIGTTSTTYSLEVNGVIRAANGVYNVAGTIASDSYVNYAGELIFGTGSANNLSIKTNSTNRIFISSGGDIGIGTTTPNQKLQIIGNVNVSGTLYASNVSSNSPLQLQTAGVTRMYINDSTGNVGINITSPTSTLHVMGTVNLSNDIVITTTEVTIQVS